MKRLIMTLAASVLVAGSMAPAAIAKPGKHGYSGKSYLGKKAPRRFTQREIDTLPIRITRPDNSSKYIFQDFPAWAARAFEPARRR